MARYQIPEKLIDQVQILLRKEALLESFNPNDTSIPPPPSLEDAIAGIGSSGNQLRCKHCRGQLLRGSESIICVYCGQRQEQAPFPETIAFKSTLGFEYLRQSLHFDGSEIIGPPIGETKSTEGLSSLKNESSMSDFLNLELKWPEESKRFGVINKTQLAGERFSALLGVDLNDLLPDRSTDTALYAGSEQARTSKKIEIKESAIDPEQRSVNLFEDPRSSESTLKSNEGANDESFGWEAEFQSAVPDAEHEQLQVFEAVKGPPTDNASQADFTNEELDVNFVLPSPRKKSKGNILVGKVRDTADASSGFNWPPNDQQKSAIVDPSHVGSEVGDDSFNLQTDSRILTEMDNNHYESSTTTSPGTSKLDISHRSSNFAGSVGEKSSRPEANNLCGPGDDSLGAWNDFTISTSAVNSKLQTMGNDQFQVKKQHNTGDSVLGGSDFAFLNEGQQDQLDIGTNTSQDKTSVQDESNGLWSTGVSMAVQDGQSIGSGAKLYGAGITEESIDSFNMWNDFKSSVIEKSKVDNSEGDKTMDVWDDFTSLGASKDEQKISKEEGAGSSVASCYDNSFNACSNLTESTSLSVSYPMSNDMSFGEWNDFSKPAIARVDQLQSSGKNADESPTVLEVDDSFSSWSNLRSSGIQENNFPIAIATELSQDGKLVKESSPVDAWDDFGHSILMPEKQYQASRVELSDNKPSTDDNDFFSGWSESGKQSTNLPDDQLNINGVVAHDDKLFGENDDSFDAWTDFTSSSNVRENQRPSSSTNALVGKEPVSHDIFASWNVLTSSSDAQAGNNHMELKEGMADVNLFSTINNNQGVEHNISPQPELLFGVFGNTNGSSQVAVSPSKVSDSVRTENGGGTADVHSEPANQSDTTTISDVETFFSEMHDLSFMLESSLSIPKRR